MVSMDEEILNLRRQLSRIKEEFTNVLSNDLGNQVKIDTLKK
jgi:hypothetical protein